MVTMMESTTLAILQEFRVNVEHVRDSPFLVLVKPFQVRPIFSFGEADSSAGMFRDSRGWQ